MPALYNVTTVRSQISICRVFVIKVMEISLGVGVLLGFQLKSVQINNIHAIILVHRLASRAIFSALVNAAL